MIKYAVLLSTCFAWFMLAGLADCAPQHQIGSKTTCKDGERWMEDCNNCWCDNGQRACTLKGCVHIDIPKITTDSRGKRETDGEGHELPVKPLDYANNCELGDAWKSQDCNRCNCAEVSGKKIAVCTRRICSDGNLLPVTPGWEKIFHIKHTEQETN